VKQNFTFDKAAMIEWLDRVLCVHVEAALMTRSFQAVGDDPDLDDRVVKAQSDSQMIVAVMLIAMKHFNEDMSDRDEYVMQVDMSAILKKAEEEGL
jgi:cobalamin biosynthesis Co2+ chelatase CbiK